MGYQKPIVRLIDKEELVACIVKHNVITHEEIESVISGMKVNKNQKMKCMTAFKLIVRFQSHATQKLENVKYCFLYCLNHFGSFRHVSYKKHQQTISNYHYYFLAFCLKFCPKSQFLWFNRFQTGNFLLDFFQSPKKSQFK